MSYLSDSSDAALKDVERITCQRDQLREALELAADVDAVGTDDAVCRHLLVAIQHKARAALKATEEE